MTFLDRIKETSTSIGTGTFTLGGAVLGYKVFTNGTYKYCIVNETESEWEVGEGTVASGVLTRTTIEASSNGGAAVSFSAGTKYVFNTVSAAYVNSLVPYTGAIANVNLGAYNITATNIIRAGGLSTQFLKADGSVDSTTYMNRAVYDTDGNGVVDAAEKMQTIGRNATGATLYKGTIVYISGSTGNRPNFVKAQANSEATSAGTFGVVVSDIANNADGYVATIGTLADLDTRTTATNPFTSVTLADGDTIYLDPNTAGYVTNVKPSAPNHIVYVGKVVRTSPTLGTIVYRIQNGYELSEIHDVSISSVANNDVLVYETATTLWKNKSIATILGYTPANDSLVVHLAGAENITGVKTFQNALQTTTGDNLLNTGGGNTYVGYTATTGTPLKFNVKDSIRVEYTANRYVDIKVNPSLGDYAYLQASNTTGFSIVSSGTLFLRPNDASNTIYLGSFVRQQDITASALYGSTSLTGRGFEIGTNVPMVFKTTIDAGGGVVGGFIFHSTDNANFAHRVTASTTSLQTIKTTGQLQLHNYTSTSVFTGTVAGLLGFDSSGNVITSAAVVTGSGTAGQVTYWSGTSAVTGSSNLVWDNTNGRLGIGLTSPADTLHLNSGGIRIQNIRASLDNFYTSGVVNGLKIQNTTTNGRTLLGLVPNGTSNLADFWVFQTSDTTTNYSALAWGFELTSNFWGINAISAGTGTTRPVYINATNGQAVASANICFYTNGNVGIGSGSTTAAQKLQVIGSMRVGTTAASAMYWDDTNSRLGIGTSSPAYNLHIKRDFNGETAFRLSNTSAGNLSQVYFSLESDASSGAVSFGKYSSTTNSYKIINSSAFYFYNSGAGNISILNDFSSGNINFAAGGSTTAHMTIKSNGRINMSSLPTSATGLSAGDLWNNLGIVSIV